MRAANHAVRPLYIAFSRPKFLEVAASHCNIETFGRAFEMVHLAARKRTDPRQRASPIAPMDVQSHHANSNR